MPILSSLMSEDQISMKVTERCKENLGIFTCMAVYRKQIIVIRYCLHRNSPPYIKDNKH